MANGKQIWSAIARPLAEEFSFALAVVLTPPVIARGLYRLLKADWPPGTSLLDLLLRRKEPEGEINRSDVREVLEMLRMLESATD